jgi:hypothetical protein
MYGMGLTMYLAMVGFQLPLLQVTTLPSRLNKEATTMDKADFNPIGPNNRQKGNSKQSTSRGTN